jgi:fibronectin type 3 domain-containing protein
MLKKSLFGMPTLIVGVMLVFGLMGCDNGNPAVEINQTPNAADFDISGTGAFAFDGTAKTVGVTAQTGKTTGAVTVKYNGNTAAPSAVGTYTITFDVAAAAGWNAVSGLSAGTLIINAANPNDQTPVAGDFNISGTGAFAFDGTAKTVIVTAQAGKTTGAVTVKYNGNTAAPSAVGAYTVTFDVAAAAGWNAVSGLSAGTLIINAAAGGENNVVIILESNAPYGWQKTYEPASLLNGTKIGVGDTYTFTYSFTSNAAIDQLQVLLVDNCEAAGWAWNVISGYVTVRDNIAANMVISGSVTLTATGTATNATPEANRLVFQAGTGTTSPPTLTFTTLKLEKGTGGGGEPIVQRPSAPTGVTPTTQSSSSVLLTWNPVPEATGYVIAYLGGSITTWVTISVDAPATSYTHTGLESSTRYTYDIRAKNSAGDSGYTEYVYATTGADTSAPDTPTGLAATRQPTGAVYITWTPVSGATSYKVYGSYVASGIYTHTGTVTTPSFTSTAWSASQTVYFRVTSVNGDRESEQSAWVSVGPASSGGDEAPSAPTGVTATAISSSSITVMWNPVSNATEYYISRSTSAAGTYTQVGTSTATSYTDTGLSASTTYYYQVTAYNSAGPGAASSSVSATTNASSGGGGGGTVPSAPSITNITVIPGGTGLRITWSSPITGATSYNVYRSNSQYGTYTLLATKGNDLVHDDMTVNLNSAGASYYYQIAGVNSAQTEGSRSAGKGVTLPSGVSVNFTILGRKETNRITAPNGQPRIYYYQYYTGWWVTIGSTEYRLASYPRSNTTYTSENFDIPPGTYTTFQTRYRYQEVQIAGPGHASPNGTEISVGTNTTTSYVNRPPLTLSLLNKYTIDVITGEPTPTPITLVMK